MRALALPALLFALAACGGDTESAVEAPPPVDPPAEAPAPAPAEAATAENRPIAPGSRPEMATGTISIEGDEESVDLRLATFDDAPLPFSTYVPTDWTDNVLGSGEGTAVFFATSEQEPRGFVSLFVPSDGARESAVAVAREVAEQRGGVRQIEAAPWAVEALAFSGDGVLGTVRVGEHAGTFFAVHVEYPAEMGDGMAPRAALVLDRLRWADDGTGL